MIALFIAIWIAFGILSLIIWWPHKKRGYSILQIASSLLLGFVKFVYVIYKVGIFEDIVEFLNKPIIRKKRK